MGNLYRVTRNGTPVAGEDFIVITSAANRRCRIRRIIAGGLGSSSAPQMLEVGRVTGGSIGSPATSFTPSKAEHVDQPVAAFTATSKWTTTQPTADSNPIPVVWNAAGGANINNVLPKTMEARNGESMSLRCPSSGVTPQLCEIAVEVEED